MFFGVEEESSSSKDRRAFLGAQTWWVETAFKLRYFASSVGEGVWESDTVSMRPPDVEGLAIVGRDSRIKRE